MGLLPCSINDVVVYQVCRNPGLHSKSVVDVSSLLAELKLATSRSYAPDAY